MENSENPCGPGQEAPGAPRDTNIELPESKQEDEKSVSAAETEITQSSNLTKKLESDEKTGEMNVESSTQETLEIFEESNAEIPETKGDIQNPVTDDEIPKSAGPEEGASKVPEDNSTPQEDADSDRADFSAEKFKIEIKNLPKNYGMKEFRALLNKKLGLNSTKIKVPWLSKSYAFACFRSEEDRDKAISILKGFEWKKNTLDAVKIEPSPDPLVKKRKEDSEAAAQNPSKKIKIDDRSQEEELKTSCIPLWDMPYEEQLQQKQEEARNILKRLGNQLSYNNPSLKDWLEDQEKKFDGLPCELLDIRYPEQHDGYANKCSFTVGIDHKTNLPTVGFRVGSYVTGSIGVGPIDCLSHIPEKTKMAVKAYETFVRNSKDFQVFDPEHHTGHFRTFTVRVASKNQMMLVFGINPQKLSQEELTELKKSLIQYFTEGDGKEVGATSMYYQPLPRKQDQDPQLKREGWSTYCDLRKKIFKISTDISALRSYGTIFGVMSGREGLYFGTLLFEVEKNWLPGTWSADRLTRLIDDPELKLQYLPREHIGISGEAAPKAEHLWGDTHIYEEILGLKLRISPNSFFQINTAAAEILYSSIIELAQPVSENCSVVDVCCGTGPIALSFAKICKKVLGMDIVPEAIQDANENAKLNSIENSVFVCGKAEDTLGIVCNQAQEEVIAVVDPPKAGLHAKAVRTLRRVPKIKKIIYVSSCPAAAVKNFVNWGRNESKTLLNEPFVPVKAVVVDMFPHTKQYEFVIEFERFKK